MQLAYRLRLLAPLAFTLFGTAAASIPAQWESHEVRFHYGGFTTKYTCDGIRYKVEMLLRALGAREDLRVRSICTGDINLPQPFNSLDLKFALPVPAGEGEATGEIFGAEWREVSLSENRPRDLERGDCELIEQFHDQVLPLFHPQDLNDRTACVPHHQKSGEPDLRMKVLMPVQ